MIRLLRADLKWLIFVALGFTLTMVGCEGGSGGSGDPAPATDFTISATPSSLAIENGQSKTVTLTVDAVNAFASSVSVSVTGLPQGVSVDPAMFSLAPGGHQQVTLT